MFSPLMLILYLLRFVQLIQKYTSGKSTRFTQVASLQDLHKWQVYKIYTSGKQYVCMFTQVASNTFVCLHKWQAIRLYVYTSGKSNCILTSIITQTLLIFLLPGELLRVQ